jgi:hypothetical protein
MLERPNGMPRQCAWCWLVVDKTGTYSIQPGRKLRSATHGICPACKETVHAQIKGISRVLISAA